MRTSSLFALIYVAAIACLSNTAYSGFISNWEGSSGLLPNQVVDPWTLGDSAVPEQPNLSGGVLTLSTDALSELMFYIQQGSIVDTTQSFFIETRLKFVSGSVSDPARAPIGIGFTTIPNTGNALFIGLDEIFFGASETTTTAKVAVDTNDNFHTYRIEYDGVSSGLRLLYDGVEILTASTYTSAATHGSERRIYWGDVTGGALGTSQYTSFTHNALTVTAAPEPGCLAMLSLTALVSWRSTKRWRVRISK